MLFPYSYLCHGYYPVFSVVIKDEHSGAVPDINFVLKYVYHHCQNDKRTGMDTVEELNGTYYFNGLSNLSATELYFWILPGETSKQLGVADLFTLALIILGQPLKTTRAKPVGATQGTSYLSYYLRKLLQFEVRNWPTLTTGSIKRRRFTYVNNLGAFAGRWIPIIGIIIQTYNLSSITYKTTTRYNLIAHGDDKLWA